MTYSKTKSVMTVATFVVLTVWAIVSSLQQIIEFDPLSPHLTNCDIFISFDLSFSRAHLQFLRRRKSHCVYFQSETKPTEMNGNKKIFIIFSSRCLLISLNLVQKNTCQSDRFHSSRQSLRSNFLLQEKILISWLSFLGNLLCCHCSPSSDSTDRTRAETTKTWRVQIALIFLHVFNIFIRSEVPNLWDRKR